MNYGIWNGTEQNAVEHVTVAQTTSHPNSSCKLSPV